MQRKKNKGLKIIIIILAILLALSLAFLAVIFIYNAVSPRTNVTAVAPNNVLTSEADTSSDSNTNNISSDTPATEITSSAGTGASSAVSKPSNPISGFTFFNRHTDYNTAFRVINMFPGDKEIKNYSVKVEHKSSIVLHFSADIREGYEKLSEVLKCRVVLPENGELLYDGLMRDIPETLDHLLATKKRVTNYVDYEVTAYLETSVGNEYMNKDLYADFRFWADEAEMSDLIANGIYDPEYLTGETDGQHWYDKADDIISVVTGDSSKIYIAVIIAACSSLLLILLFVRLKKGGANNEKEE